jgi:hypothetical protein
MTDLKKQITELDPAALGTAGPDLVFPAQVIGDTVPLYYSVFPTIVEEDSSFTFDPETHGCNIVHITAASDINCTLPADVTAFLYAQFIQRSSGTVTFLAASGATVVNVDSCLKTIGPNAPVFLQWLGNVDSSHAAWQVDGRLQPA